MEKEIQARPVPTQQANYVQACKDYAKYRFTRAIFCVVSLVFIIITLFVPTVKVSGEDYYIKYMEYQRRCVIAGKVDDTEDEIERAIRARASGFTFALMLADEEGGNPDKEKLALSVLLTAAIANVPHIEELSKLTYGEFKTTVAEEAKAFAGLSATYSMYDLGRDIWQESMLQSLFTGRKADRTFDRDVAVMAEYAVFFAAVLLDVVFLVKECVQGILSKRIVSAAYARKKDVTQSSGKKKKRREGSTVGWAFYVVTLICYFITRSGGIEKRPNGEFYGAMTLSPVFYVMLALGLVLAVVGLVHEIKCGSEVRNKISALV